MPYNLRYKKDFPDSVLDVCKPTGQAMKFDHIIREIREITLRVGGSPLESTNPHAVFSISVSLFFFFLLYSLVHCIF